MMKKIYFTVFSILVFAKIYCAPIVVTSSNKGTYFDSNDKWNGTSNFPDGLILRGITGVIENKNFLFGPNSKFIIENDGIVGAHIELYGCILSPADGNYWLGLVLDGNSSEQQLDATGNNYNPKQSRLFILPYGLTRSKIEKTEIGIKVGSSTNKCGALLRCTKTDFFDNIKSIQMNKYSGKKNLSLFMDCTFKWSNFMTSSRTVDQWLLEDSDLDNDFTNGHLGDDIVDRQKRHVELLEVEGVTFLGGNKFVNEITFDEITGTNDPSDFSTACDCNNGSLGNVNACRGVGVYSWKSSFITLRGGPCFFPEDPNTTPYDPEDGCFKCTGAKNEFYGMSFGIFVHDAKDQNSTAFITGNNFVNCATGIRAEDCKSIFINRNDFKLDGRGSILYDDLGYHVGIWLMKPGSWDIADNEFNFDVQTKIDVNGTPGDKSDDLFYDPQLCVTGLVSAGIVIDNSGQSRGRSYKNVYDFLKIANSTKCGNPFIAELYNGSNEIVQIQCNSFDIESTGDSEDLRISNYKSYSAFLRHPNSDDYMGLHTPYSSQLNDKSDLLPHLSPILSNQYMTHNDWYPPTTMSNGNNWSSSYGSGDNHITFRDWNVNQYNTATPQLFYSSGDQPTKILDNSGNPGTSDPWLQILPGGSTNSCNSSSYCKFFEFNTNEPPHSKQITDLDILDPKLWTQGGTGEGWVGIEMDTEKERFNVELWPTNATESVYADLSLIKSESVRVEIISMQGKIVLTTQVANLTIEDHKFNVANLKSGFYWVFVVFNGLYSVLL